LNFREKTLCWDIKEIGMKQLSCIHRAVKHIHHWPPLLRGGLPIYRLKDFHDKEIKGTFYQSELQKVDVRDDDIWKMEKILKTKGTGNNKHYFIKWLHWSKKFNSWISARDVNNLWFYYQWEWTIPERLTSNLGNLCPCTKDSILLALSWGWRYCRVVDDSYFLISRCINGQG
jgi:hypothetical protein